MVAFLKSRITYRGYFLMVAGFLMAIVLSAIILAVYTIMHTNSSLASLDRSHDITKRLQQLMSHINDAETSQRGYIMTNKAIFWETFKEARNLIGVELPELNDVLKDPEQQRDLVQLKRELEERLNMLNTNKEYFDKVKTVDDSLEEMIITGRLLMNKVKYRVEKIEAAEERKLTKIQEETFRNSRLSVYIILVTCGLSLLLLISILVVLNREYNAKARIEKELVASEERLQQQVHKLNLSNKELEQFAYVASHDLQEPLRKIISFSERIQSRLAGLTDEEVAGSLKRLITSADRMRILINDLLNYSRATRAIDIHETVNLDDIFKIIIEDLGAVITAKKAIVAVMKLETITGNNTQLRQLFQNLVSNALKFNENALPSVNIWGEELTAFAVSRKEWGHELPLKHNRYYCVYVRDNGIGFDPQYLQQIFIIFQRLHGRSEYEGTGIGLAICKRIVENHEGFITAQGDEGKGALFVVGLPKFSKTE